MTLAGSARLLFTTRLSESLPPRLAVTDLGRLSESEAEVFLSAASGDLPMTAGRKI